MAAMFETSQIGKRQEILPSVFNIESDATPFLSMLRVGKEALASLMTWQAEIFPAVASTGVLDGTAVTSYSRVDRYLLQGVIQQFRQTWAVTTRAQATQIAGLPDEAGHQAMLAMLLLKRQIEGQISSANDSTIEAASTPWTTRGVFSWINYTLEAAQAQHITDSAIRTASASSGSGTMAAQTQDVFQAYLAAAYGEKRAALDLDFIAAPSLKQQIDTYTEIWPVASTTSQPTVRYNHGDGTTFERKVDLLRFSYGDVRTHLSTFIALTTSTGAASSYTAYSGFGIDLRQWDLAYMANGKPANVNLPPDGSGKRGYVEALCGLRCLNPRGQINIYSTGS